jgi:hypothetical protein
MYAAIIVGILNWALIVREHAYRERSEQPLTKYKPTIQFTRGKTYSSSMTELPRDGALLSAPAEFVAQPPSTDDVVHALAGDCRGRGRGILRVVEQLQVKKFETKDHIRRDRGFGAGARDPCRSPRASRRGDRSARGIGRGSRTRELDVTAAAGHVVMKPVVCIADASARRCK